MERSPAHRPAATASVALDLGPGAGALIIYPDERFRGAEIEISRTGGRRVHTGVLDRSAGGRPMLTAIFGSLAPGEYVVWGDADTPAATAEVRPGAVAELKLG